MKNKMFSFQCLQSSSLNKQSWDRSVSTVTGYGLQDQGFNPAGHRTLLFATMSKSAPGSMTASYPRGKATNVKS
jgi:hypothetical protein